MKNLLLSTAAFLIVGTASFAQATMEAKEGGTNANGSNIGTLSSQVTGNGDHVGGNGTGGGKYGAGDQTTTPGSRADAVHANQTFKNK